MGSLGLARQNHPRSLPLGSGNRGRWVPGRSWPQNRVIECSVAIAGDPFSSFFKRRIGLPVSSGAVGLDPKIAKAQMCDKITLFLAQNPGLKVYGAVSLGSSHLYPRVPPRSTLD